MPFILPQQSSSGIPSKKFTLPSSTFKLPSYNKNNVKQSKLPHAITLPSFDSGDARTQTGGQFMYSEPNLLLGQDRDVPMSLKVKVRGEDKDFEVDHIVPLWIGGTNAEENLQKLSKKLHGEKTWHNDDLSNPDSVINRYKKGDITLSQARMQIMQWRKPKSTLEYFVDPKTIGESTAKVGKAIWDFAFGGIQKYVVNTGIRVGESIATKTKPFKELEEQNEKLIEAQQRLVQLALKKKSEGDVDGANKLLKTANTMLQGMTTAEDILSPESKVSYGQIAGEALGGTLDLLPFAKGIGFVNRFSKLVKTGSKTTTIGAKGGKGLEISNKLVKSRLNDVALKVKTFSGASDDIVKSINAINTKGVSSPGKFYSAVKKVLSEKGISNPKNLEFLKQTTKDIFLLQKEAQPIYNLTLKQLIKSSWKDVGKRILMQGGEGGLYGAGYGLSDILKHPETSDTQKALTLIGGTGIGIITQKGAQKLGPKLMEVLTKYAEKLDKRGMQAKPIDVYNKFKEVFKTNKISDPGISETRSGIKIVTDNKTLLENWVKSNEKLSFRKVNKLPEGVAARFEWDYKNQMGIIYTNNDTTAKNLAHELGHFFDRDLTDNAQKKLSEIIPNYKANKSEIDSIFTGYVVSKNGGKASSKTINSEVTKLVEKFAKEMDDLAVKSGERRTGAGERFAAAFSTVIDEPEMAKKVAPNFAGFIEYNLAQTGLKKVGQDVTYKEVFKVGDKAVSSVKKQRFSNLKEAKSSLELMQELANKGNVKAEQLLKTPLTEQKANAFLMKELKRQGYDGIEFKDTGVILDITRGQKLHTDAKLAGQEFKTKEPQVLLPKTKTVEAPAVVNKPVPKYASDDIQIIESFVDDVGKGKKTGYQAELDAARLAEKYGVLKNAKTRAKLAENLKKVLDDFAKQERKVKITKKPIQDVAKGQKPTTAVPKTEKRTVVSFKGQKITTKAFKEEKMNTSEDALKLLNEVAEKNEQFAGERRATTLQEMKEFALNYLGDEKLYKSVPAEIRENIGKMKAAQQTMVDMAEDLQAHLKSFDSVSATDEQLKLAKDKLFKLEAVSKSFAGARTEASHLFSSLRGEVLSGENDLVRGLITELKKNGIESASLEGIIKIKNKVLQSNASDKFFAVWYASILSGPKTSMRNVLGNTFHLTQEIGNKFLYPKFWKEIPTTLRALPKGWKLGIAEAKNVLKGKSDLGKFVQSGEQLKTEPIKGRFGEMLDMVGRVLNAEDRVAFATAREMEKDSLTFLRNKGKNNFTDEEILKKANAYAEFITYRNKPEGTIGAVASGIQTAIKKAPALKIVVPFVRTVANVTNRQLDYIPIINMMRVYRAFTQKGSREGNQALARAFIGVVATGGLMKWGYGRISGRGPSNYNEKNTLMKTGWRPNSVKMGKTWYPYTYFGSMAGVFALVGNIHDAIEYNNADDKSLSELIAKGIGGWSQSIMDQSFLSGVSNLIDAASGRISWDKYLKDLTVGLIPIPALYTQTKDMFFQRESYKAETLKEKILLKMGFTDNLQPRLDAFGEQIIGDLVYQLSPSQENFDTISQFIKENPGLSITTPSNTMKIYTKEGEHRQLTPQEYTEFLLLTGPKIKEEILKKIDSNYFENKDVQKEIDKIIDDIRDKHKDEMWGSQTKNRKIYNRLQ